MKEEIKLPGLAIRVQVDKVKDRETALEIGRQTGDAIAGTFISRGSLLYAQDPEAFQIALDGIARVSTIVDLLVPGEGETFHRAAWSAIKPFVGEIDRLHPPRPAAARPCILALR